MLFAWCGMATPIAPEYAQRLAQNFWNANGSAARSGQNALQPVPCPNELSQLYVFTANDGGFVILAADNRVHPIVAYSEEGGFDFQTLPETVYQWLLGYQQEIESAVSEDINATAEIRNEWNALQEGMWILPKGTNVVAPLLTTKWGQGTYYNAACPSNTLVGCVAVAMGQVMKYWNYPEHGTGTCSYTYGGLNLSADFENTTYDWAAMPNSLNSANSAVATLLFHCGVGCHMEYGPSISNAYMITSAAHPYTAESALKNHFGYSTSLHGEMRAYYADTTWIRMLKEDLDAGRPLIYNGFNASYSGGHCFVCDGYDDNDFFHINWGQKGAYDGYFTINAMTPSNQNFSYNQGAIFGVIPMTEDVSIAAEDEALSFSIFPNPTSGTICISASEHADGVSVYDISGKLLIYNEIATENFTINLGDHADGIYFVSLMKEGKIIQTKKIVKN